MATEVLTDSGDWTVPAEKYMVWTTGSAGGGGGAGGSGGGGSYYQAERSGVGGGGASGGSAGDACINFPIAVVPGQVIPYVVGAAGVGGTGSAGGIGGEESIVIGGAATDGGATTFGNLTLYGGLKGNPGAAHGRLSNGAGGAGTIPADPQIEGAVVSTASMNNYLFWNNTSESGGRGGDPNVGNALPSSGAAGVAQGLPHIKGAVGAGGATGSGMKVAYGGGGGAGGSGSIFAHGTDGAAGGDGGEPTVEDGEDGEDAVALPANSYGCGGGGGAGGGGACYPDGNPPVPNFYTGGDGGDGANGGSGIIILRY